MIFFHTNLGKRSFKQYLFYSQVFFLLRNLALDIHMSQFDAYILIMFITSICRIRDLSRSD